MARALGFILILVAFPAGGCGRPDLGRVPVRGTILYKGLPLRGGVIAFAPDPDRGGIRDLAVGEVRLDGTYTLRSEKGPGASPGWYRVSIAPTATPGFPGKYRDPVRSGLEREVAAGRENVIDFHLED